MPVPNPNSGEKKGEFISRCYQQIKDEYPRPQALGICYSQWKGKG